MKSQQVDISLIRGVVVVHVVITRVMCKRRLKNNWVYSLDCWRCRCTGWAEVEAAGSATRWTDSVWIPQAPQSLRLRALAVWLRCCSQHGMTLHVSLICCEQNASKLLFRFSFRPFFWVSLMGECFSSSIIFFKQVFLLENVIFLDLSQFSSWIYFRFLAYFWFHQRNHNIFWGVF